MTNDDIIKKYQELNTKDLIELAEKILVINPPFRTFLYDELISRNELEIVENAKNTLIEYEKSVNSNNIDDLNELIDDRIRQGELKIDVLKDLEKKGIDREEIFEKSIKTDREIYKLFLKAKNDDYFDEEISKLRKKHEISDEKLDSFIHKSRRSKNILLIIAIIKTFFFVINLLTFSMNRLHISPIVFLFAMAYISVFYYYSYYFGKNLKDIEIKKG